jgi:hypothetical protein
MRTSRFLLLTVTALVTSVLSGTVTTARAAGSDVLVSVGSPSTPFPQSWQSTPALAVDPVHPGVVAATAMDTLDAAACSAWDDPTFCPFGRVGFDGVYFSFDGGGSWTQPTYTGLTRRECLGPADCQFTTDDFPAGLVLGPIGTVPNHAQLGVLSTVNPSVAFGPVPGPDGTFSWANGSRLYHAHLIQSIEGGLFKGTDAVGISRIDGHPALTPEIVADQSNWMAPVYVNRDTGNIDPGDDFGQNVWADNAASSPHFGEVYVCQASFREVGLPEARQRSEPESWISIILDRSTDGGTTWSERPIAVSGRRPAPVPETAAEPFPAQRGGRAFCRVRTDSAGTVYVFWNAGILRDEEHITLSRSFDGGRSFEPAREILSAISCGTREELPMDGRGGAGAAEYSSMDIANGAPTGGDATDQIVVTTCDGSLGINAQRALVITSTDGGETWSHPVDAARPGDRPKSPTVAISPDGDDVYLLYQAFLDPWREDFADPRRMQAVALHAEASDLSIWTTLHRGALGDARASTGPSNFVFPGAGEHLGLYQGAAATRDGGILLWTDIRNAERCPAMETWWLAEANGVEAERPAPNTDCPPTFGNSDIYGVAVADPTP